MTCFNFKKTTMRYGFRKCKFHYGEDHSGREVIVAWLVGRRRRLKGYRLCILGHEGWVMLILSD
ncbi:hypothetical protein Hanom_Chr07g00645141 [Helianthus anomalus]